MADITAKDVMALRQKTGCGMMECKKALAESNGDMEGAIEYLRKVGMAKAQKRADRSANNGKWAFAKKGNVCVLVEGLCETDFVANTPEFKKLVQAAADKALAYAEDGDIAAKVAADNDVELKAIIAAIGENMRFRRAIRWVAAEGAQIGCYVHTAQPFVAMVEVAGECDDALLNNITLHITASNPTYICREDVPAEVIAKETEIAKADPKLAGKPEKVLAGAIAGKLAKVYKESCLMEMPWIDDEHTCLAKVAPKVKIVRFIRWMAGEEIAE